MTASAGGSRGPADLDRPLLSANPAGGWGSDAIALALRAIDLPYVALNPGASYRGLHDSLVNFLGNRAPQMLLCLHEEHAVAIAHGYAKVTNRPMGAVLHSNVGLMHATMAIFDAWCDRMPVILLGAQGPVDAALRRPWIDWIHTTSDPAAPIRNFIKWDNQPASIPAMFEAVLRAALLARTEPRGPVYVSFDAALQEAPLAAEIAMPDATRFAPPLPPEPSAEAVRQAAALLAAARRPLMLAGRMPRDEAAWRRRIALAERLGARVLTDRKTAAGFPTDHPLHPIAPQFFVTPEGREQLIDADVILSLDWIDLAGTLASAWGGRPVAAKIIHASCDLHAHNGWSMDHCGLPPVDAPLLANADRTTAALLLALGAGSVAPAAPRASAGRDDPRNVLAAVARALRAAAGEQDVTLIRLPLGWPDAVWPFRHPLDFLGGDGGAGVGSGPGIAVGAALALLGSGRLPVAVLGDGDFLMGVTALWTAARYRIPLLVLVANNHSYMNDEMHQDRIARDRGRPPENRGIGQRLEDPAPDIAGLARAQGLVGIGPVTDARLLPGVLAEAVAAVRAGAAVAVDIHVDARFENSAARRVER